MQYSSGFLLGLSTGVICLAYCGPVLLPYLMGEGKSISRNIGSVSLFLMGRLLAYLIVALVAGIIGSTLLQPSRTKTVFIAIVYMLLAVMLVLYGFHRFREVCLGRINHTASFSRIRQWSLLFALAGGFATGLNFCPPFLLAITGAMETGNVAGSLLFFLMFFLGTSIYFIPMPFVGFFRRQQVLRIIGKFAAILAGIIYMYNGMIMLLNAITSKSHI